MSLFRLKPGSRPATTACRLRLTNLECRLAPAVFNIANGDVNGLITAIKTSNTNNEPDIINLAPGGTYVFTTTVDPTLGTALPSITTDNANTANTLTFNGRGATLQRTGDERFRFLIVDGTSAPLEVTVNDLTLSNGNPDSDGGAVFIDGAATTAWNGCKFLGNSAKNAGAIASSSASVRTLTFTDCEFANNSAVGGFGGAVAAAGPASPSFIRTIVRDNRSDGDGSGFWGQGSILTVANSSFINNANLATDLLPSGGAIFNQGDLSVSFSNINNNTTFASGGGIFVQGNATIVNSSLSGNNSTSPVSGGGALFIQGNLTLTSSTIDGNRAGSGGGLALAAGTKTAAISFCTISDNTAFFNLAQGGGVFITSGASVTMYQSIVSGNAFESTVTGGQGVNVFGPLVSQGYNLIGNGDGGQISPGAGDIIGTSAAPIDAKLGPLVVAGGSTFTRGLLPGSPALDSGDPNFAPPPDFDQRGPGFPRVIGRIDIGALEAPIVDIAVTMDDAFVTTVVPGQQVTYTITVTNFGPLVANGVSVQNLLDPDVFINGAWTAFFTGGATGNVNGVDSIDELINMPVGSTAVYILTVTVNPSATGSATNTAVALPPLGFSDLVDNNTATDTNGLTPIADLAVVQTIEGGPASPGQVVRFTFIVSNAGPSTAPAARVTNVFQPFFSAITWTTAAVGGASSIPDAGSGDIFADVTLPPASALTFTVLATIGSNVINVGVENTVFVTPPDSVVDPEPGNNSATGGFNVVVGRNSFAVGADAGQAPQVRVFDVVTGTVRSSFLAYGGGFRGGVRVAVADFNGDGTQDIVTAPGAGGGPHIRVFDGLSGFTLYEFFAYDARFAGGVYVAAGDVNFDGVPDIVTGAGAGGGPHVRVFDGRNGALIANAVPEFFAYAPTFTGGVRVAVGDVNGDGFGDIVTAAGRNGGPHVQAFDSTSGLVIRSFFAYSANFRGGVYVTAGDVNGDGLADIITGAGEGGGPHVRYFDGASGLPFRDAFPYPPSSGGLFNTVWTSGVRVAVVGDFSGDGLDDFLVGPGPGRNLPVRLINAATNGVLAEYNAFDPTFLGGVFVGGA